MVENIDEYKVKKIGFREKIRVEVPGSKSITNRALMLAALSQGICRLKGVLFSDDSRAFLSCLESLGFKLEIDENGKEVTVYGQGGIIPNKKATIDVRSAGTAARFLTVMLSVCGGEYILNSSEQMKKRPMRELIVALRDAGITVECLEEEDHFPFRLISEGLNKEEITIDTSISSQYASALLMAVSVLDRFTINLTGNRTEGAYIKITTKMMSDFGIELRREGDCCRIHGGKFGIEQYQIEPDASAACYFYAMAPMLRADVIVKNLNMSSIQGDMKFVEVMQALGCRTYTDQDGFHLDGRKLEKYQGIDISMNDFSDQTMTMAAVAAFAKSDTIIRNVGHIKLQESDRVAAIVSELGKLGVKAWTKDEKTVDIYIHPTKVHGASIETYNDHRVAMAFTLPGLLVDGVIIKNPMCCRKTFENYFEIIDAITSEN